MMLILIHKLLLLQWVYIAIITIIIDNRLTINTLPLRLVNIHIILLLILQTLQTLLLQLMQYPLPKTPIMIILLDRLPC